MFNSFETPMCKTVCKNLDPHGTFVEGMDFYFQNSVLISDSLHVTFISQFLQKNVGLWIIFLRILDPRLIFTLTTSPRNLSQDTECFGPNVITPIKESFSISLTLPVTGRSRWITETKTI